MLAPESLDRMFQGTIGGTDAAGSGRKLTGTGGGAGLAVEVVGGATGDRGTVSLSGNRFGYATGHPAEWPAW